MAALEFSRPATRNATVAKPITSRITGLIGALAAWNDARATRNALSALSNRELEDIGLVRGDIDDVAKRR